MPESFDKVAVIGTGLMGGSVSLALKRHPQVREVRAWDTGRETRERALELGVADVIADTLEEAVSGCELVFIATPAGEVVGTFAAVAGAVGREAIVTDVASVKLTVTEGIDSIAPPGVHYVGGHPMTGSEQSGVEYASAELYVDVYYILTPTGSTDPASYRRLHGLLTDLGARVISMDPRSHDIAMATVSHVPHLLSLLLMEMADRQRAGMKNLFTIAASGFRDMTRIAASSPDIWVDICMENRGFIIERLQEYAEGVETLAGTLRAGDREAITAMFEDARRARAEMSLKPGQEIGELYDVHLPVRDTPGMISAVTTAVGSLGINIEDISIAHPLEGETGILTLKVLGEEKAREAAGVLDSMGYAAGVQRSSA